MDLVLTGRVTSSQPSPASGGGLVAFEAATAVELQRRAQQVFDAYGDPAVAPLASGTVATMVRGLSLGASASGTQFVCTVQMEPDESLVASTPAFPIDNQTPLNAIQGTHDQVGFSSIQCIEFTDPSELARWPQWASNFWAAEYARKGVDTAVPYLYEQQVAGPFNRVYVCAILWGFQNTTFA